MAKVDIPFRTGSDERDHDLACELPIRLIEDGEYTTEGAIRKRRGFELVELTGSSGTLSSGELGTGLLGNGSHLAIQRAWDLVGVTNLHGVDAAGVTRRQDAVPVRVERVADITSADSLVYGQVAVLASGAELYACVVARKDVTGNGRVLVTVLEVSTGNVVLRETLGGDSTAPRVVALSDRFLVTYKLNTGSAIHAVTYQLDAGFTKASGGSIVAATTSGVHYDLCSEGATAVLTYTNGSELHVARLNSAMSITASDSVAVAATALRPTVCVDNVGDVHVVLTDASLATVELYTFNAALSALDHGPTSLGTFSLPSFASAAHLTGSTNLGVVVQSAGTINGAYTLIIGVDHTGLTGTPSALSSAHGMTKPLALRPGSTAARMFCGFRHQGSNVADDHYPTLWLGMCAEGTSAVDGNSFTTSGYEPVAQLITDGHSRIGTSTEHTWPTPWASSSGEHYVVVPRVVTFVNGTMSKSALQLVRVAYVVDGGLAARTPPRCRYARTAYVGGPMLRCYDGHSFGEVVPMAPQHLSFATGVGSNLAAATYTYVVVLEWEDANGELHRSAPSPVGSRVHAGTNGIIVTANLHFASMLDLDAVGSWRAVLYRAVSATYYRVTSLPCTPNSAVVFTEDSTPDASLLVNPVLYTTGGEYANEPPPASTALCVHRGRIFGVSAQDPRIVFYSKPKAEGIAPEFNGLNQLRFDDPVVAVASLNDVLVAFTATDTWVVSGEGPNAFGQGTFGPPERVVGGVGASGAKAAITIPLGVLVHSPAGFRLLNQGLQVVDADLLAESWPASYRVGRAVNFPTKQQVWFCTEVAGSLHLAVFDYRREQLRAFKWQFRDTELSYIADLEELGGVPQLLMATANLLGAQLSGLLEQSSTSYADNTDVFVPMRVTTGWFKPDDLTGDARFRQLFVLMSAPSDGEDVTLHAAVSVQRPEGSLTADTFRWTDLDTLVDAGHVVLRRGRLQRQRGVAVRVVLTQVEDAEPNAQGPLLHGIAWDVATRGEPAKQGGSRATQA